jgi:hypothetical protein
MVKAISESPRFRLTLLPIQCRCAPELQLKSGSGDKSSASVVWSLSRVDRFRPIPLPAIRNTGNNYQRISPVP